MRVVSRRVLDMSLSGGIVRSVMREVRFVMVIMWRGAGATYNDGRLSISVPGQSRRRALARGVFLCRISFAV
jgi:hypothetical protein